jgi:hypothetical protein
MTTDHPTAAGFELVAVLPSGEPIVSATVFRGRLLVASETSIYEYRDSQWWKIVAQPID